MWNVKCFLFMVIKQALVLFCTCQINHIVILVNIPRDFLLLAELLLKCMEGKKKKETRKKKDIAIPSEV